MIEPHGGRLVDRVVGEKHGEQLAVELDSRPSIELSPSQFQEAVNIANGRFSPLKGFMSRNDFVKVAHDMTLEDGTVWSLPVTLDVGPEVAATLVPGESATLVHPDGTEIGVIKVREVYKYNAEETAEAIFGTSDADHPGVTDHLQKQEYFVGGDIVTFERFRYHDFDLLPAETRVLFAERGWEQVLGFQTRNAPHRAHEYIQKSGLEHADGLFIQPKLGNKKPGDYRDEVIMRAYRTLIEEYYVENRVALSVFPSKMRYAGPREAIFDAIVRKNHGCTHFVIGRDHAGVEDYYEGFDAHRVFDEVGGIGIEPVFYSYSFYCERCDGMTSEKVCPHGDESRVHPSGTRIRELIQQGAEPSEKMMRAEVATEIMSSESPFVPEGKT